MLFPILNILLALKFIQLTLSYIFPFKWTEIQSKTTDSYYWLLPGITSKSDIFFFSNIFWVIFLWSKSNDFLHKEQIRSQYFNKKNSLIIHVQTKTLNKWVNLHSGGSVQIEESTKLAGFLHFLAESSFPVIIRQGEPP